MDERLKEVLEGHLPDRICILKLAQVLADLLGPAEPGPDQEGDDEPASSSSGEGQA